MREVILKQNNRKKLKSTSLPVSEGNNNISILLAMEANNISIRRIEL
jgi:hypothetical protein